MEKVLTEAQALSLAKIHKLILKQLEETKELVFSELKISSTIPDTLKENLKLLPMSYGNILIAFGQINEIDQALISGYYRSVHEMFEEIIKKKVEGAN